MSQAAKPTLAVIPFGAREADTTAAAVARQLARRIVERFERSALVDARPVYLVAVGEGGGGALVFGSAPDAKLAAEYARGVSATHALHGALEGDLLRASLVNAADGAPVAALDTPLGEGDLVYAEGRLATAVAQALGVQMTEEVAGRLGAPLTERPEAYRAFLVGMDLEMAAGVLRRDRPEEAEQRSREAVGSYLAALRADPQFEAAEERLLYVAAEHVERSDHERAMEILEDVVTTAPRSWRTHYMLGEIRREHGLPAQAVVAFELADSLHPLSDADQIRLAQLYASSDAPDIAAARLRRVKPASTEYGRAQAELGAVLLERGDARGAAAALERARGAGLREGVAVARLAQAHLALGDDAKARETFESGATDEDGWALPAAYGTYLHGEGELSRALDLYRRAVDRGAPAVTRLNYARALIVADQRDAALEQLRAVLDASPDVETAAQARRLRFGLERPEDERRLESAGQIAVGAHEGDIDAARADLADLTARAPDLWEAHFGLGLTHRRAGDAVAAEASFHRALTLWPHQPDAEHELGVVLLMQGKLDDAVVALEEAAHHRPDDPGYLADAGFGYMVAGNLHAARSRLERAREIDADDEITKQYLAELERRESEESHSHA